ncbi:MULTISPECIES: hypothetical protein [unclassified Bacillus (in: firmicutes)]|uniref:hypothetical protein n=1 Tax=unclassified Bacillus (in: firmicutes) TaxID=185979 RepID=UPI001CB89C42|nr:MULTISPECIES: hypothetical protein [unclassified Bacillus (in: firmicutes)]
MEKLSSSKGLILSGVAGISVFIFTPFAEATATKALEKEQSSSYSSVKSSFDLSKEPTIDEITQYWNLNEEETAKFKKAIKEAQSKTNGETALHGKFTSAIKAITNKTESNDRRCYRVRNNSNHSRALYRRS